MFETYRMLGREREAELLREADRLRALNTHRRRLNFGKYMNTETKEKTMIKFVITLALLALAITVPVAQAEPPAGFARAVIASSGPLDPAIAAAVSAHRHPSSGPLDPALAAAVRAHRSSAVPARTVTAAETSGFDWSDFGIGAGGMLVLLVSLGGLRLGTLKLQARHS